MISTGNGIDDCLPNPCLNNGTCTDMFNYYQCDCVAGFNGKNCDNSKRYKCIQSILFSATETMKISLQMFILMIEFYVTFGENTEKKR